MDGSSPAAATPTPPPSAPPPSAPPPSSPSPLPPSRPAPIPFEADELPELVGRGDELAAGLAALDGSGRRLVFCGGPGSGKTALLDVLAAAAAERDAIVLRAGAAPDGNEALVALAVLGVFELLARDQQLVVVLDDAQWIDRASLDMIGFALRRSADVSIVLLVATRTEPVPALPDPTVLELAPLGPADARTLLAARAPGLTPAAREAVLAQAQGNPLALVEIAASLRATPDPAGDRLPISGRIRRSFAERLDQLGAPTRALLVLVACSDTGELTEIAAAADASGLDLAELDAAQEQELIRVDDQVVRFTHPVIASIVLDEAGAGELRTAHGRLAEVLRRSPARALRHRAAAAVRVDETLATELEQAAASMTSPGAAASIATVFERAAQLSEDPAGRARRLAAAADASRATGRYDTAEELLARIDLDAADERTRLSVDSQRAWHQFDTGDVDTALTMLIGALVRAADLDAAAIVRPAAVASIARWLSGNRDHDTELRALLAGLDTDVGDDSPALVLMALAASDATHHPERVLAALERAADRADAQSARQTETAGTADSHAWELARLADAALVIDAVGPARSLGRRASDQLRSVGSFGALATALGTLGHAEFAAGNWTAAVELGDQALAIAETTGQARQVAFVQATLACIAAAQGRDAAAADWARRSSAWALPRRHRLIAALSGWSRLTARLVAGDVDSAARTVDDHLRPPGGRDGEILVASACADVVEVLARADRADDARRVLDWIGARLARWPSPTLSAHAARAAAVLADVTAEDDATVDRLYADAVRAGAASGPFDQGRIRLLHGAWLRRARRPSAARTQLVAAQQYFGLVDAQPWLERTAAELRATGQPGLGAVRPAVVADDATAPTAGPDPLLRLTAQERQVVELAAQGLSNRQIGERLFLSPRTVGSHLYKAFPKLEVSNRAQLRDALVRAADRADVAVDRA